MGRRSKKIKDANELPKGIEDLLALHTVKRVQEVWRHIHLQEICETPGETGGAKKINPWVYNKEIGLGLVLRANLLRAIFKTILCRDPDNHALADEPWQLCLKSPTEFSGICNIKAISADPDQELKLGSAPADALLNIEWRRLLCDGKEKSKHQNFPGLNQWFRRRYQYSLPGGRMTPKILFEWRFFGKDAPERYVRFVCSGLAAPGANRSLLPKGLPGLTSNSRLAQQRILELIKIGDNHGKPILPVVCPHSPTVGTAFAASLLNALETENYNVCYIPVAKHFTGSQVNDAGFRSIVTALYRFVNGNRELRRPSTADSNPPSIERQLQAIRAHQMSLPTVVIFDGYQAPHPLFPAIVDFVRDEPLGQLLRYLQHPYLGERPLPATLSQFHQCFYVVIGEKQPYWLSMAQQPPVEIRGETDAVESVLQSSFPRPISEPDALRRLAAAKGESIAEWQLRLADFLMSQGILTGAPQPNPGESVSRLLEEAFDRYWDSLTEWQRILFSALSLSETGLRRSTVLQIFDAYTSVVRHDDRGHRESAIPTPQDLKRFLAATAHSSLPALLVQYADAPENRLVDAFDFPSQSVTPVAVLLPLMIDHQREESQEEWTLDFLLPPVRRLIWRSIPDERRRILRRILAELTLQAYRIAVPAAAMHQRMGHRASRYLVEALFQGMLSVGVRESCMEETFPNFSIRVIPPKPADAFSFLYFVVYRKMLCGRDLTAVGRRFGNGDLELELLLLTGHPQDAASHIGWRDLRPAIGDPGRFVRVPAWLQHRFDSSTATQAGIEHLLALCANAKRATRLELFELALKSLRGCLDASEVHGAQGQLSLAILRCDLALHSLGREGVEHRALRQLFKHGVNAIVQGSGISDPVRLKDKAGRIRAILRELRDDVDAYVRELPSQLERVPARTLSPKTFIQYADKARSELDAVIPIHDLPADAISVLSRLAILTAHSADALALREKPRQEVLARYLAAFAFFMLSKRVASKRMQERPFAEPSRLNAQTVEETIRVCLIVRTLWDELKWIDEEGLLRRLNKMVRSTLDTFVGERDEVAANRVVIQILESSFARTHTESTRSLLCRAPQENTVTEDRRFQLLAQCMLRLKHAEFDLLPICGRPGLRVLLCGERIACLLDAMQQLFHSIPGFAAKNTREIGYETYPMMEWIAQDLLQIAAFIEFLKEYSPVARQSIVWRESLKDKIRRVKALMPNWRLREYVAEWARAYDYLQRTVDRLEREFSKEEATESLPAEAPCFENLRSSVAR